VRLLSLISHLFVAGVLLTAAACATSNPFERTWEDLVAEYAAQAERAESPTLQLEICNRSPWELRVFVYVERSGVEYPLGPVGEGETVVFRAGESLLAGAQHYRLITRPFGGGQGLRTQRADIVPGGLHRWTFMPTSAFFHGKGDAK
jgi:hypothetical protein